MDLVPEQAEDNSGREPKHCGKGNQRESDRQIKTADDVNRLDEVRPKYEVDHRLRYARCNK